MFSKKQGILILIVLIMALIFFISHNNQIKYSPIGKLSGWIPTMQLEEYPSDDYCQGTLPSEIEIGSFTQITYNAEIIESTPTDLFHRNRLVTESNFDFEEGEVCRQDTITISDEWDQTLLITSTTVDWLKRKTRILIIDGIMEVQLLLGDWVLLFDCIPTSEGIGYDCRKPQSISLHYVYYADFSCSFEFNNGEYEINRNQNHIEVLENINNINYECYATTYVEDFDCYNSENIRETNYDYYWEINRLPQLNNNFYETFREYKTYESCLQDCGCTE